MSLEKSRILTIARNVLFMAAVAVLALIVGRLTSGSGSDVQMEGAIEDAPQEVWTCSMHPQVRQPEFGTCPICAMDLILLDNDDDEGDSEIPRLSLGPRAMALMEVETSPVVRKPFQHRVRLVGRVDYDERRYRDVVLRAEGEIENLLVNYVNAPVRRGQRLADIYSPSVLAAAEELLVAHRSERDERMRNMARRKLELLGVSSAQIEGIVSTGRVPKVFSIYSPIDGVVISLHALQGSWVERGERIMSLVGVSGVWVQLEAYESDLSWIKKGQYVHLTVEGRPGEEFQGTVEFVDPSIDAKTRTARVRVHLDNPDGKLKPGMLARAELLSDLTGGGRLKAGEDADPLLIPSSAVLYTGKRSLVYVRVPDAERPTFEPRDILLGPGADPWQLVVGGLAEGELVVSWGAFKIDSELQIRGRPSMMSADSGTTDTMIRLDVPVEFSTSIGGVVQAYTGMAEALADDDPESAAGTLPSILHSLSAVRPQGLGDEALAVWQELSPKIDSAIEKFDSISIYEDEYIERLREYFEHLSDLMDQAVSLFGYGDAGPVFRAHCPMAFNDRGAGWLQSKETVANPYFGASMLRCGTIEPVRIGSSAHRGPAAVTEEEGSGHSHQGHFH